MGKDAAQGIQRAGGWGPVFLDGGSGYDLGAALGAPRAPAPTRGRAPCRGARRGALPRMSAGTCGAMRRARAALQRETSHALACPSGFVCSMTCLVAKRVCADLGVPNRAARARRAARAGGGGARVRQGAARAPRWPPRCASTARSGTWPACWGARTGRRVCRVQPPSSRSPDALQVRHECRSGTPPAAATLLLHAATPSHARPLSNAAC